jgi:hypothetical protein
MAADGRGELRALVWEGVDEPRLELALLDLTPVELRAWVTQLGTSPIPYRLSYELTTATGFQTQELVAVAEGAGWRRRLELRRGPDGAWSSIVESKGEAELHQIEDLPDLSDAIDCDVGRSPLTNTLPVLRLGLLEGGEAERQWRGCRSPTSASFVPSSGTSSSPPTRVRSSSVTSGVIEATSGT